MTEPYYRDDAVTLYHGDCLEIDAWLAADVLVTDPPYGIAYTSGGMSQVDTPVTAIAGDGSVELRDRVLLAWDGRPALVFGSWRAPRPPATRQRLVWHKAAASPGFMTAAFYPADEEIYVMGAGFVGQRQTVITTHEPRGTRGALTIKVSHPTPKPVSLMEILVASCPPGTIADPFAGSGSTLVAARNLGRKAIGVELEERYCEVIARRLSQDVLDFGSAS